MMLPKPTGTCEEWLVYFEKKYGGAKIYNAFSLEEVCMRAWRELNKLADTWEPTIRGLYDIQVALYVIQLCDKMAGAKASTYDFYQNTSYYIVRVVNHARTQLQAAQQEMDVTAAQEQYGGHLDALAMYLAAICEKSSNAYLHLWIDVYKRLWSNLFMEKRMLEREETRLRQVLSDYEASEQARKAATLGLIHLNISKGEDENAWERAETGTFGFETDYWFDYMKEFADEEKWDRLLAWLRWLRPTIEWENEAVGSAYLAFWDEAGKYRDVAKEYREAMVDLLPASYVHYADYLIKEKDYLAWADLCLLLDLSLDQIDAKQLKVVEKADLKYLLPIYHHAVEALIQGKNRADYVRAVKLMKKLAGIYKKLKYNARFEVYMAQIMKQYARYRSFTEELRREGLVV